MKISQLVRRIIAQPRPLLLAFDLDGTLADITADPNRTTVSPEVLNVLDAIGQHPHVHVAIVTGRDLQAFNRMVALVNLWRVVEHGGLIFSPGELAVANAVSSDKQAALHQFETWAKATIVPRGAVLELKRTARGVHVRELAKVDPAAAEQLVKEASSFAETIGLYVRHGRMMVEADAVRCDKVEALEAVCKAIGSMGLVFAGDDFTDFEAIRFAQERGGIGIFVRSKERPTGPKAVVLDGPSEIKKLLLLLSDELGKSENHPSNREVQ